MSHKPGKPYPLGATWDGLGVNFALFSENATKVELCLFDSHDSPRESQRIELQERTDMVWHVYLERIRPGQLYGYRISGPFDPEKGHRFNANKVVLDPYAKAIGRKVQWHDEMFPYKMGDPKEDLSFDTRDNAPFAPLATVLDPSFTWGNDHPPRIPWNHTVIYELHVKGMTALHPGVPEGMRGTYGALATREVIRHFKNLGVTAVELLPVHHHVDDKFLLDKGLVNYWGYNTLGYFAPEPGMASAKSGGAAVREFKQMVRALHAENIEVILDVVYNHTAEGNHLGPMFSLRGVDNASYYHLVHDNRRYYMDFTGTGNTLNMQHPRVLQLIMDSLRYWVLEMHVDGFRFDLASTLARELFEVDKLGAFFDIIRQDPVLSQVKLIAEPWDLGDGGYQVGGFPPGWTEWNGKFRDAVRRFWKGDGGVVSEFATRLAGSSDLYEHNGRKPYASINFITCHDGFTLSDLVSYNEKHNEANKEDNRDGESNNLSWNCGVEGPTDDPSILALREKQKRNFLATLFLSQGVPMLSMGDELGRTQKGNNNVYCQDNETSWMNWDLTKEQEELLKFTARLIQLQDREPVFNRREFFQGRTLRGSRQKDIEFYEPTGQPMDDSAWNSGIVKCMGIRLAGDAISEVAQDGQKIFGDTFLILINAHHQAIPFQAPPPVPRWGWERILDTIDPDMPTLGLKPGVQYDLKSRSLAVFKMVRTS